MKDGETYNIQVPSLIDPELYQQAQNVKYKYLLSEMITGPCGVKWNAYSRVRKDSWTNKSTGEKSIMRVCKAITDAAGWDQPARKITTTPIVP